MNSTMNEIIFQDINDNFAYGIYLHFNVIIMKSNGYINATKLCKHVEGKDYKEWRRYKNAQELIKELENSVSVNSRPPEIECFNIENNIKGIYVHPDLIPHIASYMSPKYAIMISKIVNEYAINHFKTIMEIKDKSIKKAQKEIHDLDEALENKSDNYVVAPANEKKQHVFYITREPNNLYKVHRIQKERFKETDNIVIALNSPNAINMGVRLRERLRYKYNQFILDGITENELKKIVIEINNEKYQ